MPESMRIAAFLDKGGVGKTTAIAHIGVALEEQGYDVLLVDLAGKQGDLAKHFGLWQNTQSENKSWPNITTVFQKEWEIIANQIDNPVNQLLLKTGEGPDLIPAHEGLDGLDSLLSDIDNPDERYTRLDSFLTGYVDERYDMVLLDLPGSTSNIAYNGLWAAKSIIAPVRPGPFEEGQTVQLRRDLKDIQQEREIEIELVMLLLNELDERKRADKKFHNKFSKEYSSSIAPRQIPSSQDIVNAQIKGKTIFSLEDPSATAKRARDAYRENATELVNRLEGTDE